jgi:hypothetical protein
MQACLDAVNWEWLSALPSTRARVDALLEGAGHEGGYINGDLELPGGWIDSAILHGEIWDAIEYLAGYEADKPLADLLRTAWEPILAGGDRFDELGLIEEADGCFDASLAPASVARVAAAIEALDLAELAREINPDEEEDVLAFLRQRAAVVRHARDKGWGVVAHMA